MSDVTANLNLPADPPDEERSQAVEIPATPYSPALEVSDIPVVQLPLTTAAKAHLAGGIAAASGAGEVAIQLLPDGAIKTYISAGVAVVTVIAIWLGVYVVPNIPKITKK